MYDESVHFYFIYGLMRSIGKDEHEALSIANASQAPDNGEVWDAMYRYLAPYNNEREFYRERLHDLNGLNQYEREKYLECVTGLLQGSSDSMKMGLYLHAIGDWFAHQDPDGESFGKIIGHALYSTDPDNPQWVYQGSRIGEERFRSFVAVVLQSFSVETMPDEVKSVIDSLYDGSVKIDPADLEQYRQSSEFFSRNSGSPYFNFFPPYPSPKWIPNRNYDEILKEFADRMNGSPLSPTAHKETTESDDYIQQIKDKLESGLKNKLDCCLKCARGE